MSMVISTGLCQQGRSICVYSLHPLSCMYNVLMTYHCHAYDVCVMCLRCMYDVFMTYVWCVYDVCVMCLWRMCNEFKTYVWCVYDVCVMCLRRMYDVFMTYVWCVYDVCLCDMMRLWCVTTSDMQKVWWKVICGSTRKQPTTCHHTHSRKHEHIRWYVRNATPTYSTDRQPPPTEGKTDWKVTSQNACLVTSACP